ncbi:MAG TPA: DUF5667 domain-containing protein [Desulfobacteria bacterium]|nr:DUF5667 domain-containing protein [Desulfobacteria bacterium]
MKKLAVLITTGAFLLVPLYSTVALADTTTTDTTTSTVVNDTTTASTALPTTTDSLAATTDQSATTTPSTTSTTQNSVTVVDTNGQAVEPGILPGSPFYWLENLVQKLELALTFGPENKAKLSENQALQKLADAEALVQQGNQQQAQQALSEYTAKIAAAQNFLSQVQDPNSTTAQQLQTALSQTNAANIRVLSGLLDKLPPQAAQKIALNIVRAMERDVNKLSREQGRVTGDSISLSTPDTSAVNYGQPVKSKEQALHKQLPLQANPKAKSNHQSIKSAVKGNNPTETYMSDDQTNQKTEGSASVQSQTSAPSHPGNQSAYGQAQGHESEKGDVNGNGKNHAQK